jgi:hypothetical protein
LGFERQYPHLLLKRVGGLGTLRSADHSFSKSCTAMHILF